MSILRITPARRLAPFAIGLLIAPLLGGCDWISRSTSDTTMRNVEILPGTASDEMITLDQASGDGTAIDASRDIGPVAPSDAAGDSADDRDADDAPAASSGETSNSGDVVIRPPDGE